MIANIITLLCVLVVVALLGGFAAGMLVGALLKEEVMEAIYILTGRGY